MSIKKRLSVAGMLLMLACMVFLCGMTGTAAAKKIALNKTSLTIMNESIAQLKLKGAAGKVKWKSSKKSVASVNSSGKVTAKNAGTCKITAVYRKKTYTCTVKVEKTKREELLEQYPAKKNRGKILLAGSSSMARWASAAKSFAPYEIVNMAISGTTIKQWSTWYKTMIVPYKPTAVVWYVGGNDLWKKRTPAETAKLFCETAKKLHKALPDTEIYYVSVYTNIKRKSISKQILSYNKKIMEFCKKNDYVKYIDLATVFNNNETPLKELLADGLHPNAKGYKIWRDVVATKVKADMKALGVVPTGTVSGSTGNTETEGETAGSSEIITGTEIYEDEVTGEVSQTVIQ